MSKTLYLDKPEFFDFRQVLFGHGWSQLLPFEIVRGDQAVRRVFALENSSEAVSAEISDAGEKLKIEIWDEHLSVEFEAKILRDVRHILRFDDDLQEFYKLAKTEKRLGWIAKKNAGRLLRSPTIFEDLIKTICTTNCSWALTKKMVFNLVEKLGTISKDGKRAFPTAEQMANVSEEFYRTEIRAGYRSAYLAEAAERAASGEINPEKWFSNEQSSAEIKKEMKQVKGVGNYAAENLLKLVGRYDGLALDSWLRAEFYKKHNSGNVCPDSEIEAFYEKFGDWRGLVMWCDMSEE